MGALETKERVMTVIALHAENARNSQYDRSVAINAVASARQIVLGLPFESLDTGDYGQRIIAALNKLRDRYNDPDGQFTNGKGVLGSLIDDICLELSKL